MDKGEKIINDYNKLHHDAVEYIIDVVKSTPRKILKFGYSIDAGYTCIQYLKYRDGSVYAMGNIEEWESIQNYDNEVLIKVIKKLTSGSYEARIPYHPICMQKRVKVIEEGPGRRVYEDITVDYYEYHYDSGLVRRFRELFKKKLKKYGVKTTPGHRWFGAESAYVFTFKHPVEITVVGTDNRIYAKTVRGAFMYGTGQYGLFKESLNDGTYIEISHHLNKYDAVNILRMIHS